MFLLGGGGLFFTNVNKIPIDKEQFKIFSDKLSITNIHKSKFLKSSRKYSRSTLKTGLRLFGSLGLIVA